MRARIRLKQNNGDRSDAMHYEELDYRLSLRGTPPTRQVFLRLLPSVLRNGFDFRGNGVCVSAAVPSFRQVRCPFPSTDRDPLSRHSPGVPTVWLILCMRLSFVYVYSPLPEGRIFSPPPPYSV